MMASISYDELHKFRRKVEKAREKSKAVQTSTDELRSTVVECIQKIERHDSRNKRNQAVGTTVATGGSIGSAFATGGSIPIGAITNAGIAIANCRAQRKTCKHWNVAKKVLDDHHKRRLEFVDAYLDVYEDKDKLCSKYPNLHGVSISALTEDNLNNHIWTTNPVWSNGAVGLDMVSVMDGSGGVGVELVVDLSVHIGSISVGLAIASGLTFDAAIIGLEFILECLPFLSIFLNAARLASAASAMKTPSREAMKLRTIYDESMSNLDSLGAFLEEF